MWIKNYVLTIITVIILSSIIENLLPESNMKKHIYLVGGLIIISIMIKPLLEVTDFFTGNFEVELNMPSPEISKIINNEISKAQDQMIDDSFAKNLSDSISFSIKENLNIDCHVAVKSKNGLIEAIIINCKENNEIKELVESNFGLNCTFTEDG